MLGFLSSWKGQRHIPFRPARIPKCPAACRVVTDCFTASNTFNRQVFPEIRKAPVILTRKMASAGWWVPYSVFDMGKAQPICRAYKIIYPCIPSTIHSSTISQKFISYLGCRLLNHNVALQLSQSDKSTATYPPIPEPNIPKVVGR